MFFTSPVDGKKGKISFKNLIVEHDLSHLDFKDDNNKDSEKLQWFMNKYAIKHQDRKFGKTHALFFENDPIGYITFSTSSIQKDYIHEIKRPFTRTTRIFPAIIIEYLAIDRKYRGNGLGREIIKWSVGLGRSLSKK